MSVHYIKVYVKGGVKKLFCLCRKIRCEFPLSITFKAIDSPQRISSKIHTTYFTWFLYHYIQRLRPLAFRSLCLVSTKFILFCLGRNVYLIYHQQTSHTNLKSLLVIAFQFQLHFYARKPCKYHQHSETNHWQQIRGTRVVQEHEWYKNRSLGTSTY